VATRAGTFHLFIDRSYTVWVVTCEGLAAYFLFVQNPAGFLKFEVVKLTFSRDIIDFKR